MFWKVLLTFIYMAIWGTALLLAFLPAVFLSGIVDAFRLASNYEKWMKP